MKSTLVRFAKLHGLGNDWVAVDTDDLRPLGARAAGTRSRGAPTFPESGRQALPDFARSICDRHTGVGADGLIVVTEPKAWHRQSDPKQSKRAARAETGARARADADADVDKGWGAAVRFFNADGSEAEMSGNGIRCAAGFLWVRAALKLGDLPAKAATEAVERLRDLRIETVAGVRSVATLTRKVSEWTFRVGMGSPVLDPTAIPFGSRDTSVPVIKFPLRLSAATLPVTLTSMGNPHCSVFVDRFEDLDWQAVGREIERHQLFPHRTNVEFVKVRSRKRIDVRFWERGVGETQSSGTGSCAAVVACILNHATGRKVRVDTVAGTLEVAWPEGGEVSLTGPAALIAQGTYQFRG